MRGTPSLRTKGDIENAISMVKSGKIKKQPIINQLQSLLDTQKCYFFDKTVAVDYSAGTNEKVEELKGLTEEDPSTYQLMIFKDNPNSSLKKMNLTAVDVSLWISELGD